MPCDVYSCVLAALCLSNAHCDLLGPVPLLQTFSLCSQAIPVTPIPHEVSVHTERSPELLATFIKKKIIFIFKIIVFSLKKNNQKEVK